MRGVPGFLQRFSTDFEGGADKKKEFATHSRIRQEEMATGRR